MPVQLATQIAQPVEEPRRPIPARLNTWHGQKHTWVGWDGSIWPLTEPMGDVFLAADGIRGTNMPDADDYESISPGVAGSRHRGYRTTARDVFWPLCVRSHVGTERWLESDRGFWRTMRRGRYGTWTITLPSGSSRSLRCRFLSDSEHILHSDPFLFGWAAYGIRLKADQPYWEGSPAVRLWEVRPPSPMFGDTGIITISPGSTLAGATIDNPGDVNAWPVWTLRGPMTSASVGIAGRTVEVPFPLADGERLTIDTDPTALTAVDSAGNDRTPELGDSQFAAVEPGDEVALSLAMVGGDTGSSVEAHLTPLYERAWG